MNLLFSFSRNLNLEYLFACILTPFSLLAAFKAFRQSRVRPTPNGIYKLHFGLFLILPLHSIFLGTRKDQSYTRIQFWDDYISFILHSFHTSYIDGLALIRTFSLPPKGLSIFLLLYPIPFCLLPSPISLVLYFQVSGSLHILTLLIVLIKLRTTFLEDVPIIQYLTIFAFNSLTSVIIAKKTFIATRQHLVFN
ncbi:unnamed protein product [Lepeophtheirus salmonis]|uniref:(salmon louse) hypothetical protein n=1 Tax=Lepeophtheirus salmonis TaxID=72036 RepID=A0A7R8H2C2_LEPSM|nr:unnamed protein product [Lepeophtheirus salmonis]CAF2825842.1 unnamed protein product [Lepeophtheirus salmonis]